MKESALELVQGTIAHRWGKRRTGKMIGGPGGPRKAGAGNPADISTYSNEQDQPKDVF